MLSTNVDCVWTVYKNGYRLESVDIPTRDQPQKKQLFLVGKSSIGSMDDTDQSYKPLTDEPALFRAFADLDRTPESIREFANSYGHLGGPADHASELPKDIDTGFVGVGEPISVWQAEIAVMKEMVDLWDLVRAGNLDKALASLAFGDIHDPRMDHYLPANRLAEAPPVSGAHLRRTPRYDLDGIPSYDPREGAIVAAQFLQNTINPRLKLLVGLGLYPDRSLAALRLKSSVNSLLGALWLQFATSIAEVRDYGRCDQCRKWFEIPREVGRDGKAYCSGACRNKAYRERIGRARQLWLEGFASEEIAEQLGTTPDTVQGWLRRTTT